MRLHLSCLIALVVSACTPSCFAAADLTDIAEKLAREGKTAIVIEGTRFVEPAAEKNISLLLAGSATTQQKIERIAQLLDYSIRSYEGVSVWNKNYSAPDDFPCVTEPELAATIQDAAALVEAYVGSERSTVTIKSLIGTFTPEQRARLATTEVSLNALTPEQYELYSRMACNIWLSSVPEGAKGYDFLRDTFATGVVAKESALPPSPASSVKSAVYRQENKVERPIQMQFVKEALPPRNDDSAETLRSALKKIKAPFPVEASEELKDKPILVAGTQYATADHLTSAIARLYDLRVEKKETRTLLRRRPMRKTNIGSVLQNIWDGFPLPLRNAAKKRRLSAYAETKLVQLLARMAVQKKPQIAYSELTVAQKAALGLYFSADYSTGIMWYVEDMATRPMPRYCNPEGIYLKCTFILDGENVERGYNFRILEKKGERFKNVGGATSLTIPDKP